MKKTKGAVSMKKFRVEYKTADSEEWFCEDELMEIEATDAEEAIDLTKDYMREMEKLDLWYRAWELHLNDFGKLEYNYADGPDFEDWGDEDEEDSI